MPTRPPAQRTSSGEIDGRLALDGLARWTLGAIAPQHDRVPYSRKQALHVLQLWQIEDDLTWRTALLLSELATNAVRHAGTPFTVMLSWDRQPLRCEASDVDPRRLVPQQYVSVEAIGGRGLILVHDLSSTWGVELHQYGKTVWFTLTTDGHPSFA